VSGFVENTSTIRSTVYLHTAEDMSEVDDVSVKLMIGASVYLGKGVPWKAYDDLYRNVYHKQGQRVLREDGLLVILQTNAYLSGKILCRYKLLLDLLLPLGWELIDEKVWQRAMVNFFQVPFSHVFVLRPVGGTASRIGLNRCRAWQRGIWNYPQRAGGKLNAWPNELCRLLIEACTAPGDLIVDPFAGTGRLLSWAGRMGRNAIGYEIDHSLIDVLKENGCDVI